MLIYAAIYSRSVSTSLLYFSKCQPFVRRLRGQQAVMIDNSCMESSGYLVGHGQGFDTLVRL